MIITPYACPNDVSYEIYNNQATHMTAPGTTYKDGPGGTITVSVQSTSTISMGVSASVSVSASALFASAQASVSASLEKSVAVTVGHSYSRNITAGKFGHVKYGSWGQKVWFRKVQLRGDCSSVTLGSGTASIPSTSMGWKYWETAS